MGLDKMRISPPFGSLMLLLSAITLSRLPVLMSDHLLLDADEAILGLMAKHLSEGRGLRVFVYGQNYGLALPQTFLGGFALSVADQADVALKISALGFWSVGVCFLYGALYEVTRSHRFAALFGLAFVLSPAWMYPSTKFWAELPTAFTLSSMVIFLVLKERSNPIFTWSAAGLLTGLVMHCQPIYVAGLCAVFAWKMSRHRATLQLSVALASFLLSWLPTEVLARIQPAFWLREDRIAFEPLNLFALPGLVYTNLTGSYFLRRSIEPHLVTQALAWVLIVATVTGVGVVIFRFARLDCSRLSSYLLSSIMLVLGSVMLVSVPQPRYLLPLSGLIALWIAAELTERRWLTSKAYYAFGTYMLLGIVSTVSFRDFCSEPAIPHTNDKVDIERLVARLAADRVHHVFSTSGLLQWQLTFYSDEMIIARYDSLIDRYPKYVELVDGALESGAPTAVVGFKGQLRGLRNNPARLERIELVGEKYFVLFDPTREVLQRMNFELRKRPGGFHTP